MRRGGRGRLTAFAVISIIPQLQVQECHFCLGPSMATPHANDVSGSEWFHTARVVFRVGSGGEGGSSPKAGGEEGESVSIELHSGRHVYFIGAMGETSLKKVQVKAVQGDSAATILRICAGLWKSFRLAKMNSKLYWQAYYLMRGNGDFS